MAWLFIPIGEDAGALAGTIATIPTGATASHYRRLGLWVTPSTAITYAVDYERDVTDMVNAMDEPMLPLRFHRLVGIGARAKEYEKKDDPTRMRAAQLELERGMKDLKYFVASGADVRPVMGRQTVQRPSTLGGWYPSGT